MSFSRSSNVLSSKEENYYKKEYYKNLLTNDGDYDIACVRARVLDSSLISQTKLKKYDIKIVECGRFKQVYFYEKSKFNNKENQAIKDNEYENNKIIRKNKVKNMFDDLDLKSSEESRVVVDNYKEIDIKNINRTKIQMQRLVKSNIDIFKTFITLTFDSNKNEDIDINKIEDCHKKFNIWKTYIKRLYPNFAYVCVPEFQKRGAVHYHLLTNIEYNDFNLLSEKERKIWNKKDKEWKIGRDVKGWKYGLNMAINMKNINVVGYLTKYMTKDIDNRLFGKHKYLNSYNLKKPVETYINLDDKKDMLYYLKEICDCEKTYENIYLDKFENMVYFYEYEKNETLL